MVNCKSGQTETGMINVGEIQKSIAEFVEERAWQSFHTPKALAIGIMLEAAELSEIFQWISDKDSYQICENKGKRCQVADELADIFQYLIELADLLDIDLEQSFQNKMLKNREKYPSTKCKGLPHKYHAYAPDMAGTPATNAGTIDASS